jgi:hypothetical protein
MSELQDMGVRIGRKKVRNLMKPQGLVAIIHSDRGGQGDGKAHPLVATNFKNCCLNINASRVGVERMMRMIRPLQKRFLPF